MKKVSIFLLAVLFMSVVASPGYSAGPVEKLSRGISNIFTFPCEIPHQINETYEQSDWQTAAFYGTLKGLFYSVARLLCGGWEVVTFPIPWPGNFEPILTDPEYFFSASNSKQV